MASNSQSFNHFPDIARALPTVASKIVRKAALDIEAQAKSRAPVDTGFLRSSIYTVTADSSDYGRAGKSGNGTMLPEIPHPPANPPEADVAVGAAYGVYVEYGTSKAPAQPYLAPAVDAVRPGWEAAWRALEERLRAVSGGGGGAG